MGRQRQYLFWPTALVLLVLFFIVFSPILLPFVAGAGLAYLLDPVAQALERHRFSRLWSTVTILVGFVLFFLLALVVVVPILVNQLSGLIADIPSLVESLQKMVAPALRTRFAAQIGINEATIRDSIGSLVSQGAGSLTGLLGSLWRGGRAFLDVISLLVVTPVVAFYLLYDWDRMMTGLDSWLPQDHAPTIRALGAEIGDAVAGFVRGQGLVCLILGTFYAVGLGLVGLDFGLLIGFSSGLISFIPYVGSITGFVVAMAVAMVQFWPNWGWIIATAGVFAVGQFFEGNFLQPRLVGARAGLHPVAAMFALFAFGYLFGLVGLLIAVPAAAAIGVLVRFAIRRYLDSDLHRGAGETVTRQEAVTHQKVRKG